ncbi:MBL fold metallo-hydrolase [Halioxenophilus sp. WMMB6]|uniref:MBL fold metallo-hydrolase n=1 Tax=Halioxenophilus sp. WMMB6 TaxID=3073815 RepID=UPI00295E20F4|nr:MBL fold metallo-hydrolase [Halioxenophilus sp. WMMB6]
MQKKLPPLLAALLWLCCGLAPLPLKAEEASPALVFITLGTQGGPQPNPVRAQPANLLQVNGSNYLIDAGNGVAHQLTLANIPVEAVKTIFISHNHDDHNADLGTLMGLSWSMHNRDEYTVFGPAGTQEVVDGFMSAYSVNSAIRDEDSPLPRWGKFNGPVAVHTIGDAKAGKQIYKDDNLTAYAIENCHYHHDDPVRFKSGEEKSYAFRFEMKDKVIVFSGDTGPCDGLVDFYQGADLLVHEVFNTELMVTNIRDHGAMSAVPEALLKVMLSKSERYHTTPEEVGKLAAKADVGKVVLTHVMPGRASDPDAAYIDGVRKYYSGEVVLAKDLDRF